MDARTTSLEEFLKAVLRGAAKILGCSSANLILINEPKGEISIRLGTRASSNPILAQLEEVLGDSFRGITFTMEQAAESLIFRCWRDQAILETSSLSVLVGSALSRQALEQMEQLIGEHRYVCVPALSGNRDYGVILFEKEGAAPFSRQQSEVVLRFARRIGEILENDLMGQGQTLISRSHLGAQEYLLFDLDGQLVGQGPGLGTRAMSYLSAPGNLDAISQRARRYLSGDPAAAEESGELWLDADLRLSMSRFSLGQSLGVLCSLRTSGARTEMSLENQLLHLTLGAPAPALFVDPDFLVTSCNEAAAKQLGSSSANLVGRPVGDLFSEPRQILDVLDRQLLDPENPYSEEPVTVVTNDGALVPARVEAMLLADEMHHLVGFMVLIHQDQADGGEATERLVRQERLATMGEMTAQLAHELRNPLVAVGATLESLAADADQTMERRAILASLAQEIVRMDMTLKDHLAAARQELSFSRQSVAAVVREACRLLEGGRGCAGRDMRVEIDEGLTMRADRDAMKHVFFNLLLNAMEATPPGGQVTCRAEAGERQLTVLVEDSGDGLGATPEECLQPFFTTKKNGSGLGLAVCHKILRSHGGLVDIRDREGGGCRVSVVLPRVHQGEGST